MTTMTLHDTPAAPPRKQSIYDAIGGRAAVKLAVDIFFERLIADPQLGPYFPRGAGDTHRAFVATLLGEALGGPERYRGRDLATAHHGLGISDAQFDRAAGHLDVTLESLGVTRHLTDQIIGIVASLRPAIVAV
jgi:hemoglobin